MCVRKMLVCEQCLRAIECHEGSQIKKEVYIEDSESHCEFCGEAFEEDEYAYEIYFE